MANVAKNAILRAKIEGVLTDIMVKTTVGQVYVNDSTTLAAHLATLASTADVQALQQAIDALGALSKKDKVSYADLETALASLIDGKAEASALTEEIARAKAAEEAAAAAASAAQAAADKAQGDVDALAGLVGELPEFANVSSVIEYVDYTVAKTDEVLERYDGRLDALEATVEDLPDGVSIVDYIGDIGTEATSVVAYIDEQVAAIGGNFTEFEGVVDQKISDAVAAEKSRAEGIEAGLRTDINTVMSDYLKAADKTELEGKIKSNADAIELLTNGVTTDTIDGVNDLIAYVNEHGTEVTGMKADIKANSDALAALSTVASTGSWNDLTDKPFGEEGTGATITWDGNTEGRESAGNLGSGSFYHVSDLIPYTNELVGGKIAYSDGQSYDILENWVEEVDNNVVAVVDGVFVAYEENATCTLADTEFVFPKRGVYFFKDNISGAYNSSLTYGSSSIKTLDSKFIGSDIARTADLTAVEGRLTTAEGEIDALQQSVEGLGALAKKDVVSESDLDSALAEKVNAAAEGNHSHSNKDVLDGITSAKVTAWDGAVAKQHEHANSDVLAGISAEKVSAWDASEQNAKDYAKTYADGLNTSMNTRVEALEAIDHSHANATVLDGITAEKVSAWDAAEQNAKTYADGLDDAMDTRMKVVEALKHNHENKTVLDGITANMVSAWNGKAKVYAAGETVDLPEGEIFIQLI